MPCTPGSPMVARMLPVALLFALALSGAMAASSPTMFFVNNSIDIPGFDSFIQMDAFSPASLKVLDGNVLPHMHCAISSCALNVVGFVCFARVLLSYLCAIAVMLIQ